MTKTKRKAKSKAPLSDVLGAWFFAEGIGHGRIVEEITTGLWRAELYDDPRCAARYYRYFDVQQITKLTFCKDKEVWLARVECRDPEEDDDFCECPECLAETELNIERMEREEAHEACEQTLHDTLQDAQVSEALRQELEADMQRRARAKDWQW